jgi:predicted metal-dependent phosphotriesterase family hydrolase
MQKTFTETAYVICHNGSDIIHPMKVGAGTNLTSGQPEFEEFSSEVEWETRLKELGYDIEKLKMTNPSNELNFKLDRDAKTGIRNKVGRAGLLSPEERKSLKPEERKALRAERINAKKTQSP